MGKVKSNLSYGQGKILLKSTKHKAIYSKYEAPNLTFFHKAQSTKNFVQLGTKRKPFGRTFNLFSEWCASGKLTNIRAPSSNGLD